MPDEIVNTTKEENHPDWTMGGNPHAIEAQEKRGQSQLVNSELLPTDVQDRAAFESMGIVFDDPLPDDPLFCKATLPEGWRKQATDHDMWSELVDDKDVKRASIFYKAAFYDRRAFMRPA